MDGYLRDAALRLGQHCKESTSKLHVLEVRTRLVLVELRDIVWIKTYLVLLTLAILQIHHLLLRTAYIAATPVRPRSDE